MGHLLRNYLQTAIRRGHLTFTFPDGLRTSFGEPGDRPQVAVRLHDEEIEFDLLRHPETALGEAFCDGRLTMEMGRVYDLLDLLLVNTGATSSRASLALPMILQGARRWARR
jgi:cyclopropane-fatty-acyl-phospholipid synthase